MEKIYSVVQLMAKTGLFFANVDGDYQRKEKQFIDNFVSGLKRIGDVDQRVLQDISDSLKSSYTLNEIVEETQQLVSGFTPQERGAILKSIKHFINTVIRVDGKVESAEADSYRQWKLALGID